MPYDERCTDEQIHVILGTTNAHTWMPGQGARSSAAEQIRGLASLQSLYQKNRTPVPICAMHLEGVLVYRYWAR